MIHDVLLRWTVTGLFALGAVECALPILTQRRPWPVIVSHSLHVLMAVAMAAMAWPWSMRLPPTLPAMLFLLATMWFATLTIVAARTAEQRRMGGYHAMMMLATAWMYAAMSGYLAADPALPQAAASMPGIDTATTSASASSESLNWFSAASWFGALIFAAATVFWLRRYLTGPADKRFKSVGTLAQAAMAAGMAIQFLAAVLEM
ncbi:DUF5134 domain-containing protein [Mycobacterium angelicum]|uniref:DUF5134 domain-containing protein n=1 Tax=Mycobacterium angelicum TaxID=470074 RepID=A0A1W9ZAQ8_MYCAN|nr:DUF5134 domain-containing protein [Mycobacterium angelicum]MCV7199315.1 DUF5134 domain-containing protein [Mycobacterium angelicum]ORA10678.1 DUF5134 domain-containing protein [Mycobacterium angelicum]